MTTVTLVHLLLSLLSPAALFSWTLSLVMLAGFIWLVRRVLSVEKQDYYHEESLIPLLDDSDEEKQLFAQPDRHQVRRGRLDA